MEAKTMWDQGQEMGGKILYYGGLVIAAIAGVLHLRKPRVVSTDDRLDALLREFKELKRNVENIMEQQDVFQINQGLMRRRQNEEAEKNSEMRRKMDEMVDDMADFVQRFKKRMEHLPS